MKSQIECLYTCTQCGTIDRKVMVPARSDEDVKHWVENILGHAIGLDHSTNSPRCTAKKMDHVKIPIEGADRIGGPALN